MKIINQHFINGKFVPSHGTEIQELYNPSTGEKIGEVSLGDQTDARNAINAAAAAYKKFSQTSIDERCAMLQRLYDSIMRKKDLLNIIAMKEYGSPAGATNGRTEFSAQIFLEMKEELQHYPFEYKEGKATVVMTSLGVIGAITPWNADYTHIASKIAPAIATGNTIVVKPSEISALQTQVFTECLADAEIPDGVINIINGRGATVGTEIVTNSKISKVNFTGSTTVGKMIWKETANNMARMTLELGGKSPIVILEDADLDDVISKALIIAFSNSGQACHAGTRLIVPESKLDNVKFTLLNALPHFKVGLPTDPDIQIGPMVSEKQYQRVQQYIKIGMEEGAHILSGGLGKPKDLENGYFVRPTVFTNVTSDMTIAQEEIFGPVLSVLTYANQAEAVEIANDTIYGLSGYVFGKNIANARKVANQIRSGRVLINKAYSDEPKAPFGGMKQSGVGRTSGHYSIDDYLESKAILDK